jgi:hypothetical protein
MLLGDAWCIEGRKEIELATRRRTTSRRRAGTTVRRNSRSGSRSTRKTSARRGGTRTRATTRRTGQTLKIVIEHAAPNAAARPVTVQGSTKASNKKSKF